MLGFGAGILGGVTFVDTLPEALVLRSLFFILVAA